MCVRGLLRKVFFFCFVVIVVLFVVVFFCGFFVVVFLGNVFDCCFFFCLGEFGVSYFLISFIMSFWLLLGFFLFVRGQ